VRYTLLRLLLLLLLPPPPPLLLLLLLLLLTAYAPGSIEMTMICKKKQRSQ
jgi:hypothetical protein